MFNLDEKFPSKEEKIEVATHLRQLLKSKGWQLLSDFIEDDIKKRDERLRIEEFSEMAEVKRIQDQRAFLELLKRLPTDLIELLLPQEKENKEDEEIY